MILSLIFGFLLGVAALLFALQNTEVVSLTFLGWQFDSSLAILVLITLVVGATISLLVSLPPAIRDSFRIMGLRKENKKLLDEIVALRNTAQSSTVIIDDTIPQVLDIRNS